MTTTPASPLVALLCADEAQRAVLRLLLQQHGVRVMAFTTATRFFEHFKLGGEQPQRLVVFTAAPEEELPKLAAQMQAEHVEVAALVVLPAASDPEFANDPLYHTAPFYDVLCQPCASEALQAKLAQKVSYNSMAATTQNPQLAFLCGHSQAVQNLRHHVEQAAQTTANILIEGEGSLMREQLGQHIHAQSKAAEKPFVYLNCAALPPEHAELVLFGNSNRASKIAQAAGGTLMLDEVDTLPQPLQLRLSALLKEQNPGFYLPRIICGCAHDLHKQVITHGFREDLYYKLAVMIIQIPPLNQRKSDFRHIINDLLQQIATRHGQQPEAAEISQTALDALRQHEWPGNIGELQYILSRAFIRSSGQKVMPEHLFPLHNGHNPTARNERALNAPISTEIRPLEDIERDHILTALKICGGSVGTTAKRLKIGRATLYRKLKAYESKGLLTETYN